VTTEFSDALQKLGVTVNIELLEDPSDMSQATMRCLAA
jgi:hypothetical protein